MKTKILFLFAWLMATATGCSADEPHKELPDTPPAENTEDPTAPAGDRKVLIIYFSHTGNTRTIAGYIHDMVKSDMVELETEDTYTDDYDTLLAQIRQEVADEYCPPFATRSENMLDTDKRYVPTLFDFSGTCGMNLLDLLRKEEDVEIKWQKILNELYSKLN